MPVLYSQLNRLSTTTAHVPVCTLKVYSMFDADCRAGKQRPVDPAQAVARGCFQPKTITTCSHTAFYDRRTQDKESIESLEHAVAHTQSTRNVPGITIVVFVSLFLCVCGHPIQLCFYCKSAHGNTQKRKQQ